jgi:hypothetical protein
MSKTKTVADTRPLVRTIDGVKFDPAEWYWDIPTRLAMSRSTSSICRARGRACVKKLKTPGTCQQRLGTASDADQPCERDDYPGAGRGRPSGA